MIIKAEFLAGTDFKDAVREASHYCGFLNLDYVEFDFNGCSISVGVMAQHRTDEQLEAALDKAYKQKFVVIT